MSKLDKIKQAILDYETEEARTRAEQAIAEGVDPLQILDQITEAPTEIGDGFSCGNLFLPDLIGAAAAAQAAGMRDKVKIMVGGGAINTDFARSIGADGYGETAAEGVTLAKELMKAG